MEYRNRYIIVAINYFLKWLKVRVIKKANIKIVVAFIYEKIICYFGVSKVIQSDQEIHFVNEIIKLLIVKFRI